MTLSLLPPCRRAALLLITVLFSTTVASAMDRPDTSAAAPDSAGHTAGSRLSQKTPRGALFRSMVLPGWGQFYNRRPVKGGIMAAAETGSLVAVVLRERQLNRKAGQPGFNPSQSHRNLFIVSTLGLIFFSTVDAYVDAQFNTAQDNGLVLGPTLRGGMAVRLVFRGP